MSKPKLGNPASSQSAGNKRDKEEKEKNPLNWGEPPSFPPEEIDSSDSPKLPYIDEKELAKYPDESQESSNSDSLDSLEGGAQEEPVLPLEGVRSRIAYRTRLRGEASYLIDPILRNQTINLIGGPSGIGKSTWLFQILYEWSQGKPVLGKYKSTPCPYVYVTNDRSTMETDQTLERLGYRDWDIPIYSIEEVASEPDLQIVMDKFPKTKLFVIEGIQAMIPDGKGDQNRREMQWAIGIRKKLAARNCTILATTHTPKSQTDKSHSRNNFLMSASLHACVSTMISFDVPPSYREPKAGKTNDREVFIHLRNHEDIIISYTRDTNGRFRLMDSELHREVQFDTWFSQIPSGSDIPTKMITALASKIGMSERQVYRLLEQLKESGQVQWVKKGLFRKALLT